MMNYPNILGATIVALLTTLFGCSRPEPADFGGRAPNVSVTCEAVGRAPIVTTLALHGVLAVAPQASAVVSAGASGRIAELRVRVGQRVAVGDVIAVIDDPTLGAAVTAARGALGGARSARRRTHAAFVRTRKLFAQGVAATQDVEVASAAHAAAVAVVQALTAQLQLANRRLTYARPRAPLSGVVLRVLRVAGEAVDGTPATPLVEVGDPTRLEMRALATGAQSVWIRPGMTATIRLDALPSVALQARVSFVSPTLNPLTSLGLVRAAVGLAEMATQTAGVTLRPGLSGTLDVAPRSPHPALVVPTEAIRRSGRGGLEVVVCQPGHDGLTARVQAVRTGDVSGDVTEILHGLKAGDRVVTRHVLGLAEGVSLTSAGSLTSTKQAAQ